ncbi:uncharacterized protein LOC127864106 [Dreissena polymorpha]|uniref:uncharacterized protein LOC127864106 n=1 Tax=Dreissena polymorpha TaxID=45954 RepID=UPI002264F8CA|nr:uncharacterized protein LOC127864106 [Dreissena polymorpha]
MEAQGRPEMSNTSNNSIEILEFLKRIDGRLVNVEKRLDSLMGLEKKVDNFDMEVKKLRTAFEDRNRKLEERISKVEEKTESADFCLGMANSKMVELEKTDVRLREEVTYLQSHSMRNNLVFSGIAESTNEGQEDAETKVRGFIHEKMRIAKDIVDKISFERVHRMGPKREGESTPRRIVAKFTLFKERELVRHQGSELKGTPFYVNEQFPKEVSDKRRKLVPRMKEARSQGKKAWIAYDILFVDGKPVRD